MLELVHTRNHLSTDRNISGGATFLFVLAGQAELHRRNNHPQHATTVSSSRDMAYPIDPLLAKEALRRGRGRKECFLICIKSIFERRKKNKEGERNRRDLGLDSWDGFAWAKQRQEDGQRVKRERDAAKKEWVVVPNLGLERSVSPCDMTQRVTEEDEDTEVGSGGEEASIHDSFYAAPKSIGSPAGTGYARRSISERVENVTIRPSMLAAVKTDRTEQRKDSDVTTRPEVGATNDNIAKSIQTSILVTEDSVKSTRPSLAATGKHVSLRRAAICNAARISGRKGLDFWRFGSQRSQEAGSESSNGEELLLSSSKSDSAIQPANPSKSDLDGLAKLIGSIDAERVNSVRHIWHEDTHSWTHERNQGTQTD